MCRFIAYSGQPILLDNILVRPPNSLIMQSMQARESDVRTNGDGFGLGWYVPQIEDTPALFHSISPAWNDQNLLHLTRKIESPCFFAHIRAASAGGVTHYNCHPFTHGKWMFMHNGGVDDFIQVKRHLRHLLDDDIYNWIQGETDSEHIFALFLQLAKKHNLKDTLTIANVLKETLATLADLIEKYGKKGPSYYNICITDGKRIVTCRHSTDTTEYLSLHYLTESTLVRDKIKRNIEKNDDETPFVLVASEKLTIFSEEWIDVPKNKIMMIDNRGIKFVEI